MLVLALGLVVILMLEARKPEYYAWFWAADEKAAASSAGEGGAGEDRRVDTRLLPENQEARIPGTFISPAPPAPEETSSSRYFPGVKPSYLKSIRDNRPLGSSEWDTWLHLFDVLKRSSEPALQEACTGRVSFIQLFEQSKEYRGELVRTGGTLRRAHPAKTPRNDYGLTGYYQTWLSPADHPADPIAVWCLHLPEGFPQGMQIAEEVEVTGFYLKLWAYKAADGTVRRAPLILARTVDWHKRPPAAAPPRRDPVFLFLVVAGAVALAVLAAVFIYQRTAMRSPHRLETLVRQRGLGGGDASSDVGAALSELANAEETRSP